MQKWLRVHYSTVPGRVWTDQFRRMSERLQIVFARAVPTSSAVARYHSIATHPRINDPPSTTDQAVDQFEAWMESPTLEVLSESSVYWQTLKEALAEGRIAGPLVDEPRIAVLCQTRRPQTYGQRTGSFLASATCG